MEDNKRTRPFEPISQVQVNSQRQKQQTQGLNGSASGFLHMYYSFKLSIIIGLLNVRTNISLILVPVFRTLFLLVQLQYDGFCFILFYFILFYFIL